MDSAERGLSLRAWVTQAIADDRDRDQIIEVISHWPRSAGAAADAKDLHQQGVLNDYEAALVASVWRRRSPGAFAGFVGEGRRVRVLNGWARNIHRPDQCGRIDGPCWIHFPSEHGLQAWPVHYWDETNEPSRLCMHWAPHPDPDHVAWLAVTGQDVETHICDCGCCEDG